MNIQQVRLPTPLTGAQQAIDLLERMRDLVSESARTGADFDVQKLADLVGESFDLPTENRRSFAGIIAQFIGYTFEGLPPDLSSWKPIHLAA